tara:strand:- start:521 stop:670 length:150 start_codon:yes stop_codon:yes gene_type:complete
MTCLTTLAQILNRIFASSADLAVETMTDDEEMDKAIDELLKNNPYGEKI